jgi:hypothetical protein
MMDTFDGLERCQGCGRVLSAYGTYPRCGWCLTQYCERCVKAHEEHCPMRREWRKRHLKDKTGRRP